MLMKLLTVRAGKHRVEDGGDLASDLRDYDCSLCEPTSYHCP